MHRAAILSMQRIKNFGSFLQAYGLMKTLKSLDCSVEFADYHPGACLVKPKTSGLRGLCAKAADAFAVRAPVLERLRYIRYKRHFPNLPGVTEKRNYATDYDLLIIGSDEVFNCCQDNPNVGFSPELFGAGHHAKRLISYAASFGNTTLEDLRHYGVSERVAGWLDKFDALSVRDENSGRIVEALTGKKPLYHLDPVLVADFKENASAEAIPGDGTPYLILYGYSGRFSREECEAVTAYARQKRLKIYCMGGIQNCCNRFIDCPPQRLLDWFRGADCVVTDTFHGVVFSVIALRPFAAFVRNNGYGNAEKLTDLLLRLDMENHRADSPGKLDAALGEPTDGEKVRRLLARERERTRCYLSEQLRRISE